MGTGGLCARYFLFGQLPLPAPIGRANTVASRFANGHEWHGYLFFILHGGQTLQGCYCISNPGISFLVNLASGYRKSEGISNYCCAYTEGRLKRYNSD